MKGIKNYRLNILKKNKQIKKFLFYKTNKNSIAKTQYLITS